MRHERDSFDSDEEDLDFEDDLDDEDLDLDDEDDEEDLDDGDFDDEDLDDEDLDLDFDDEDLDLDDDEDLDLDDEDDDATFEEDEDDDVGPTKRPRVICTDLDALEDYRLRRKARAKVCAMLARSGLRGRLPQMDAALMGPGMLVLNGPDALLRLLAVQMCLSSLVADPHLGVVFLALRDVHPDPIHDLLLCNAARLTDDKLVTGKLTIEERRRLKAADELLTRAVRPRMRTVPRQLGISEKGITEAAIRAHVIELIEHTGVSRVLLAVDALQQLPVPLVGDGLAEKYGRRANILIDQDGWRWDQLFRWREWSKQVAPGGWPVLVTLPGVSEPDKFVGEGRIHEVITGVLLAPEDRPPQTNAASAPMTLRLSRSAQTDHMDIPLLFDPGQLHFVETPAVPPGRGPKQAGPKRGRATR